MAEADSFPTCVREAPWAEVVPHLEARNAFMHHFLQLVCRKQLAAFRMKGSDDPATEYVHLEQNTSTWTGECLAGTSGFVAPSRSQGRAPIRSQVWYRGGRRVAERPE